MIDAYQIIGSRNDVVDGGNIGDSAGVGQCAHLGQQPFGSERA